MSISPSPVMTSTRRRGWASASRAEHGRLAIAPQVGKLSGESPAAVMSQVVERDRRSPEGFFFPIKVLLQPLFDAKSPSLASFCGLFLKALDADDLLGDQDRDAALFRKGFLQAACTLADTSCSSRPSLPRRPSPRARRRRLAHRHLPGIELARLAAHRHDDRQRETAGLEEPQHVDRVADAARLHEEHALSPPSQAPAARPTPSSRCSARTARIFRSARQSSIRRLCRRRARSPRRARRRRRAARWISAGHP